jgi:uncharacterized SAM-binding protein YcdF (DUF218 family)
VFFVLSKILDLAFAPLTWVFVLLVAVLVRPRWSTRTRTLVLGFCTLFLYTLSIQPISNRLVGSLERPLVSTYKSEGPAYDAVVLLGGLVETNAMASAHVPAYHDSVERLLTTFDLLREGRAKLAILSGGEADGSGINEAEELAKQLERWGIAKERLVIENKARNTYENATMTKELAQARGLKRIVVVTSAFHMARAHGCFNAAGLEADTLSVDFRSFEPSRFEASYQPRANFFHQSTWALREWAGRAIYRARGYSSDTVAPSL